MVTEKSVNLTNALEQFVLLAKTAKGAACVELVKQVLEAPGVYVFSELLNMPNILELKSGQYNMAFDTLTLFAYGTYQDYLKNKTKYLELTPIQLKKLKHLTLVTLATVNKCNSYDLLLKELNMTNVRDLEDLIIEAIYADILHGKLDQKNKHLEIDYAIGRDIRTEDVKVIVDTLQQWCDTCEGVLNCIEQQIHQANVEKNKKIKQQEDIENEIQKIKRNLKNQSVQQSSSSLGDSDEAMCVDPPSTADIFNDKPKKSAKSKSIRTSGLSGIMKQN